MPKHSETRRLPYSPEQMFDLVADVRRYPEFLPWVTAMRVRRDGDTAAIESELATFNDREEAVNSRRWRELETKYLKDV